MSATRREAHAARRKGEETQAAEQEKIREFAREKIGAPRVTELRGC